MLTIGIKELRDGKNTIELQGTSEQLLESFPEFFGELHLKGEIHKIDKRLKFEGEVCCEAKLLCDISGNEYTETIKAKISLMFIINNDLYFMQRDSGQIIDMDTEIALHEDDKSYDIEPIIRDELSLALPLKRVSPQYRGKDFAECFPEYSVQNNMKDDRWEKLNEIKFN